MQLLLIRKEISLTTQLAYPLIAALLAQIGMELVNVWMLSLLSPEALAAGGLAFVLIFCLIITTSTGLFSAGSVLIARQYGAKQYGEIAQILNQLLYLSCFLIIPCLGIFLGLPIFLSIIGEPPEVVKLIAKLLHSLAWEVPAMLGFFALREFVTALGCTRIIMILALCAAPFTAIANYTLMYGKLGLPALGIAGIGYSTAMVEWCLLIILLFYIFKNKKLRPYFLFHQLPMIDWKKIKEIIKLGLPVSLSNIFESSLFGISAVLMGYFGTHALSANQIALVCVNFAFMFPLGISRATAIRVSHSMGMGSIIQAKYAGFVGLGLGLFIASLTAILFLTFAKPIVHLFIHDPSHSATLVNLSVSFMHIMALFQLLDAMQGIMNGALRGLKDTMIPMWLGLLSYWLCGLTSGCILAFLLKWGGQGLWWGLGIGVGIAAILLFIRFYQKIGIQL